MAATAVVVSHVAFVTGVVNPQRWGSDLRLLLPRLDVGVPVFFVLSGLLIARPFVRAVADGEPPPRPARYLLRRVLRIFPLYWVVLGVTLATATGALPSVPRLLSFVTLTHIYRPATAIGPITQSWSLATELAFYVMVPVWFAGCRWFLDRRGVVDRAGRLRWMALGLGAWVVAAWAWRAGVVAVTDTFDYQQPGAVDVRGALLTWLPNHLDNFAAGVAMAVALEARRAGVPALRNVARAGCYVGAAAALWVASAHLGLPALHTGFDGPQTFARHGLFWVCAALVVLPSAFAADAPRSPWTRAAAAMGLGSYGVYLWHQWVGEQWFERPGHPVFNTPFPTTLAVVLVASTALAAAGYWLVERWPQRMADALAAAPQHHVRQLGQAPALDGLRGLSILAVLGTHIVFADPGRDHWLLPGGFLGVDVFLALSGFLITATLLRERDRTGGVALGDFLRRRGRRLLPPMLAFFAAHAAVVAIIGDSLGEEALQAAVAIGFVANWQLTFGHQPPFDLVHLWSLAVEGQLYVLCGLAVFAARRRLDRVPEVVGWLVAGALAVALWRIAAFRIGGDLEALYERTDLRADSMIIGGLGAVLWRARVVPDRVAAVVGSIGGLGLVTMWWLPVEPTDGVLFGGGFTLISMAAVAAILAALVEGSPVAAVAGWAPLRAVGRMSYSLYLWHLPIFVWANRALPELDGTVRYMGAVAASFAVAALSYRFVEMPFLRRRAVSRGTPATPPVPTS